MEGRRVAHLRGIQLLTAAESRPESRLLLIAGADENQPPSGGRRKVDLIGNTDLFRLLGGKSPAWLRVGPSFLNQPRQLDLQRYTHVLNLVTDPDQNPRVLGILGTLLQGFAGKVVNRPEAVLQSGRPEMARRLTGVPGLIVPKTVRLRVTRSKVAHETVERTGLQLPALLRFAGMHTGRFIGKFDSADELDEALANSQHIVTEFVDFQSADGLYRKYRVLFIGRHIVFRHLLISPHWNVHGRTRPEFMAHRPELVAEEERMFARPDGAFSPEVHAMLKEVRRRVPLDFFGMDFALAPDGQAILFEANATMNFFPFLPDPQFAYVRRCIAPARAALHELVGLPPPLPTSERST